MNYRVEVEKSASRALARIQTFDRERILAAIEALETTPRPQGCKKLKGRRGWRLRSQTYRIIYDIDDKTRRIVVQVIGHRRDVYRK